MDERLKRLVEELGVAINDSVSTSEQIRGMIAQIEASGYDALLFLNATIALMRREKEGVRSYARTEGGAETDFNAEDVRFLKSMHISVRK